MPLHFLPMLSRLLTWRLLVLLLALLNLKTLPLAWHVRVFSHVLHSFLRGRPRSSSPSHPSSMIPPIFRPHVISTFTPPSELDYNLHKSNSTYFTDLDISRAALATSLIAPGIRHLRAELNAQGHASGGFALILGGVHASFRKEIGLLERYEVHSRLVCWDAKWLVIGSWFVRPAKGHGKGKGEVLAGAWSKYVLKKGRFTVPPERVLRCAGLLPVDGQGEEEGKKIERERKRGLELVRGWLGLDGDLIGEFERVPGCDGHGVEAAGSMVDVKRD